MSSFRRARRQTKRWKEEKDLVIPGSELEWQIKHANSADLWAGVGKEEGTTIWRIVKFKVTEWPKDDYGKFHEEDAYIVLNSHKIHELTQSLFHEIHFWIGKHSTPDKYGTAAYRTVDLYRHLDGGKQHREVQGEESDMFKSYFTEIEILPGGSEPGFTHVEPVQYQHRLLHFKGPKNHVRVDEVKLDWSSLNSGDVFVLDLGLHIVQWNGKESNGFEKHHAKLFVDALKSNRGGRPTNETIEEKESTVTRSRSTFYQVIPQPESGEIKSAEMGGDDRAVKRFEKQFYRVDAKGNGVSFKHIKGGILSKEHLDQRSGYVVDTGFHVFFWVGRDTTQQIKARGFAQAKEYVEKSKHPFLPLTRLDHNQQDSEFDEAFNDARSSTWSRSQQPVASTRSICTIL